MSRSLSAAPVRSGAGRLPAVLFLCLLLGGLYVVCPVLPPGPVLVPARATTGSGLTFAYDITTSDVAAEGSGGGDFDPRGKCPPDFFSEGFVLLCKQLKDGAYFKFLYHRGKRLLYRIDRDVIRGEARIGLHWVESTRFNARYRIADPAFKGGREVKVPTGRGESRAVRFEYGQAVSKKKVQPGRELFHETHINPDQCPEWWDLFNFVP